jgi:hypothetical protein
MVLVLQEQKIQLSNFSCLAPAEKELANTRPKHDELNGLKPKLQKEK